MAQLPAGSLSLKTDSEIAPRRQMDAEAFRRKITDGHIVSRCIKIAQGKEDASPTQVSMLGKLLNKILPDLKAVEIAVTTETPLTRHEIEARALAAGIKPEEIWGDAQPIEGESQVIEADSEPETDAPSI